MSLCINYASTTWWTPATAAGAVALGAGDAASRMGHTERAGLLIGLDLYGRTGHLRERWPTSDGTCRRRCSIRTYAGPRDDQGLYMYVRLTRHMTRRRLDACRTSETAPPTSWDGAWSAEASAIMAQSLV
ncbi:hypothetical protein BD626DRAFT_18994 [Schizophyllum amplum]|uniref:Uncharacterized protein n=1 Tax=Schizophyllum amplum TaxID=97359 RepID=A0A550CYF5_9AGAR|nr:hypothetical protein BD626DRAFT_18994 [Auriculariopsis ampla]